MQVDRDAIPAHLPRNAIFRRGHGGRHMNGGRSDSLFEPPTVSASIVWCSVAIGTIGVRDQLSTMHRSNLRHHRKYILDREDCIAAT
jgi:hypothetical protein